MIDPKWFGGRLRELREASGMGKKELGEAAGVSPDGLLKLEKGERVPSWETVLALAGALGVDCTAFTRPPAEPVEPLRRGRPRKASEGKEETPKKRKRKKGK